MGVWIFLGIAFVVFWLDMIFKQYVEEHIQEGEEKGIKGTGGKVVLRKVYNKGAALNAFQDHPKAVKWISGVMGVVMLLYDAWLMNRKGHPLKKVGMGFLTGGALSNLFDRFERGHVIDYVGIKAGGPKISRLTYNLGDFAIAVGGVLVTIGAVIVGTARFTKTAAVAGGKHIQAAVAGRRGKKDAA